MVTARRTLALSLVFGVVLILELTACAGTVPDRSATSASTSPTATGPKAVRPSRTASAAPTPSRTASSSARPPAAPADLPTSAKAYAEAVLAAWSQRQVSRLTDLTTPAVTQQLLQTPGLPNQDWVYQRCDGAAGSSYCAFNNADGDVITLRVVNQQVGTAHAISEMRFDRTVYARDSGEYVQGFVEAWRNRNTGRMRALSSPAEVDYFANLAPPDTYAVCTFAVGSAWQVRVYNGAGANYLIRVNGPDLGTKHAIAGHVDPAPVPAPCP